MLHKSSGVLPGGVKRGVEWRDGLETAGGDLRRMEVEAGPGSSDGAGFIFEVSRNFYTFAAAGFGRTLSSAGSSI